MIEWVLLAVGLIAGGAVAWWLATSKAGGTIAELRSQLSQHQTTLQARDLEISTLHQQVRAESEQKVAAQTELNQVQFSLAEQRELLEAAEKRLADTFHALADKALKSNNQAFIDLAKSTFETIQAQAKGDLETRQKAIDGLVGPLKESLGRYEKQIQQLELTRQHAYDSLDGQLTGLQKLTGDLNTALRGSHTKVRGRWGELTLHRVAELAGMSEFCDFTEQETLASEAGRQRPDMIVNLAGGRRFPVDSKVPLEAFLGAVSAATEEERNTYLSQHSSLVRGHMDRLAKQGYPELFSPAPEIVVMFLPGESFLAAALEQDGSLLEDAMQKRVMLATPTVLISLLLAVHHGWQQQEVAKNAAEIRDLGKQLYDRIRTASEYFQELGSALGKAVDSYNSAIGSMELRFFPAARKFKDLVVPTGEEIAVLEPVEVEPRALLSPEWKDSESHDRDQSAVDAQPRNRASKL